MELILNAISIVCWSFTTVVMTYNVFMLWRPIPTGFKQKARLRKQAVEQVLLSNRPDFVQDTDKALIEGTKILEYLHLNARFAKDYRPSDINVLVSRIRIARSRLQTTLLPMRITPEQMAVWGKFDVIVRDFWIDGNDEEVQKKQKDVTRIAIYAMQHMDKADGLYDIVKQRGVYQLKHAKPLLKDITESPAGALSDGAL